MRITLPYGTTHIETDIDNRHIANVIIPPGTEASVPKDIVDNALSNPIGSETLSALVTKKRPKQIAIIISDVTRPVPYCEMLPPVLEQLSQAGVKKEQITIVIGTGCHRANTKEEIEVALGKNIVNDYQIVNHDSKSNLTAVGYLSADSEPLLINSKVALAQLKIALGLIIPHKLAGYSGGSKAILPGVADYRSIAANHQLMTEPEVKAGNYLNNPVRQQMDKAARLVGLDFIVNVVTNYHNQVIAAVAGDVEAAWRQGVQHCQQAALVKVQEQCPVSVISCGGYPRDLNVYQAIKPIVCAAKLTCPGGTIVVSARCQEGFGDSVFEEWVRSSQKPVDIIERFQAGYALGGHKAYVLAKLLKDYEIVLISDLNEQDTKALFLNYQSDITSALQYVENKHGPDYRAYVVPYAGLILPEVKGE